jgi:hypothetical protein
MITIPIYTRCILSYLILISIKELKREAKYFCWLSVELGVELDVELGVGD